MNPESNRAAVAPTARTPLTAQQVAELAASGGLHLAPGHADVIADLLGFIGASLVALDQVNIDGLAPATAFDPGWR
jgi:hypothetical protein